MTTQLGLLDSNIFIHSLYPRDLPYARCQAILQALDAGQAQAWIDVTVLHELTYGLLRLRLMPDRLAVYAYIEQILVNPSILADNKSLLLSATYRWMTAGVGFVDAWLAVQADLRGIPICSANARDFPTQLENTFVTANV